MDAPGRLASIAAHLQAEPAAGVKRRLSKLSRDMTGRVALITGAASGQGDATARVLADEGCRLALCDINPCDELVAEVIDAGGEADAVAAASFPPGLDTQALAAALFELEAKAERAGFDRLLDSSRLLLEVVAEVSDAGGEAAAFIVDLADSASIEQLAADVLERFGDVVRPPDPSQRVCGGGWVTLLAPRAGYPGEQRRHRGRCAPHPAGNPAPRLAGRCGGAGAP